MPFAAQYEVHRSIGLLRMIVRFAEMSQEKIFKIPVIHRGHEFGALFIGEMTESTGDPLDHSRRIRTPSQEEWIVIGFHDKRLAALEVVSDEGRNVTEVRGHTESRFPAGYGEVHRVRRIMRTHEWAKLKILDSERLSRTEQACFMKCSR